MSFVLGRHVAYPSAGRQLFSARGTIAAAAGGLVDTFTDTDGTLLTAHVPDSAPDGAAWSSTININNTPNAIKIGSNAAIQDKNDIAVGATVIETGLADGVITVNLKLLNGNGLGGTGVWFRYVDGSNYWKVELMPGTALASVGSLSLNEVTGGAQTLRDQETNVAIDVLGEYTCVITLSGSSITVEVDAITLTYSSAQHATATKHGISITSQNSSDYSKFYDITVAAA